MLTDQHLHPLSLNRGLIEHDVRDHACEPYRSYCNLNYISTHIFTDLYVTEYLI